MNGWKARGWPRSNQGLRGGRGSGINKGMKALHLLALSVLLACSPALFAQSEQKAKKESAERPVVIKHIDIEEFAKLRGNKTNVVLDVRTKEEWERGHLPGAILIDFIEPDFEEKVAKLDPSKTYLVVCASGGRSARACKKMEALKFKNLYNVKGGMNAWEKAGKPVKKGAE